MGNGPGRFADGRAVIEVDRVEWNASAGPDDRCAAELTTYRHGHGRVQRGIALGRVGQLLDPSIELGGSTLYEQDLETMPGHFQRDRDTGRACADHGQVGGEFATVRKCIGRDDQPDRPYLSTWGRSSRSTKLRNASRAGSSDIMELAMTSGALRMRAGCTEWKSTTPRLFSRTAARRRKETATSGSPQSAPISESQRLRLVLSLVTCRMRIGSTPLIPPNVINPGPDGARRRVLRKT